jgi:PIN domain nuclease of toxin-antitoxin system
VSVLLDTCALLWWLGDPGRLGREARVRIADPGEILLVSAAVCWEIAIKHAVGKLSVAGDPVELLPAELGRLRVRELPISHAHALATGRLPRHHADPFDRMLVAQAQLERATILTPDPQFARYDVATLW